ncbi:MAG: uracil-DNA glycosylase, partial [Candidatus Dormibacteraceae bacterium]
VRSCRACPGMNAVGSTESSPAYGDPSSPIAFVGQSLCRVCMASQIPFTGGSGRLLDAALEKAGVSKRLVFTTNVVHCNPPKNRQSKPHEIANCSPFLAAELSLVAPELVVGLGRDACTWLAGHYSQTGWEWTPQTPENPRGGAKTGLFYAQHPAYIMRRPSTIRELYVSELATVIKWAFRYRG